ncbi:MAG: hypothetical protein ABI723_18555 [Bacteroidia bacterium]
MADEILRAYRMEDELLLTRAQTQKDALNTDLAAFTARFPWLLTAFVTAYQTQIDTAEAFPEDFTVMTDIKVLTADVNASVVEGKDGLNILFLYSEITYPTDIVKQRIFGQDRMAKARTDQEKMMNLLQHAHSFANKTPYKTDLLAKGYTQTEIDALLTIATNIGSKNRLQEDAISNRPVTTQDRILVYNPIYARMQLVYKCAQVVFAGNAAKISQYRVNPPQTTATTTAIVHASSVSDGTSLGDLLITVASLPISATTDSDGNCSLDLGTSPPDSIDLIVTGPTISDQTFSGFAIVAGEENVISVEVVV